MKLKVFILGCLALGSLHVRAAEPYQEYKKRVESAQTLTALDGQLMGDSVSLYNGATEFSATDIAVPGNNGLPIQLTRRISIELNPAGNGGGFDSSLGGAGNWDVEVPYITSTYLSGSTWSSTRCSVGGIPSAPGFDSYDFWHGNSIHLPGSGDRAMLSLNAQTSVPQPSDGVQRMWTTRERDMVSCIPMQSGLPGEGFMLQTTSGIRYYFDIAVSRYMGSMTRTIDTSLEYTASRVKYYLLASKVSDRFGNTVTYQYDANGHPTAITSSDGRSITLTYSGALLASAATNGRTWQYQYGTGATAGMLTAVTRPDASQWQYAYTGTLTPDYEPWDGGSNATCNLKAPAIAASFTLSVTHPSGAVGTFAFTNKRHYRSGVHASECLPRQGGGFTYYILHTPNYFDVMSLQSKTLNGPGIAQPMVWSYDYGISNQSLWGSSGQAAPYPCTTCATEKLVTVTNPNSTKQQYRYGFEYALNEGRLLGSSVLEADGTVRKVETTDYLTEAEATGQNFFARYGLIIGGEDPSAATLRPVTRQTIVQDGVTFTMQVDTGCIISTAYCFDLYGNPTQVTRFSSLSATYSRQEQTAYFHDTAQWVLGQVKSVTCLAPATQCMGIVMSQTDYDLISLLPVKTYAFGKLQQTLTYNADGTVATVKDGNNNVTTLSSWYRGVPRNILFPVTPESPSGATQSAVVDPNGWITQITDENTFITGYGYDTMGRLARIVYPTGDSTAWNDTTLVFENVAAAEYGIPAGHWRQTVSTGNARKITYYDAMWRPVVTREYDTANETATKRFQRFAYDVMGRASFASYPGTSDVLNTGTWTTDYDALGRATSVAQDTELTPSLQVATTEYLTGFKTRVTNPRGQQTTTSYMAYDQPTTDWPVAITHPEGAFTDIARDPFGKPTSLARHNLGNSVTLTRSYTYDSFQQLCLSIEPETSASVMDYDAAGNLLWNTGGQAFTASTACSTARAGATNKVNRTYDARNRVKTLVFPDGQGDQDWSYTPDGLPLQIITYNAASHGNPVINAYHYNKRRLLDGTGDTVTWPGFFTYGTGYGYDGNGHQSTLVYPSLLTLDMAPNALGQPTKAGSYATGASYYPNGAIKQFTYGNGIVHTMTQNARQLPSRSTDSVSGSKPLDLGYSFDGNANVSGITDYVNAHQTRGMSYDNLDRLTQTTSNMFGTASYSYDVLDNLKTVKANGRDHTYNYDAKWQLGSVKNNVDGATVIGLGYDAQGNVTNKNGQLYTFDFGNRLRQTANIAGYAYDGYGRRVLATNLVWFQMFQYSQAGQLLYTHEGRSGQKMDHIYLGGSLVAERDTPVAGGAATVKYQHTDALGTPIAVTDASKAIIQTSDYEPYGQLVNRALTDGPGFTGHFQDATTGLTYMQQRYYDPVIGRFLSVDPVTADGNTGNNFNRYKYAANNPFRFTDPDGRLDKDPRTLNHHSSNIGGVKSVGNIKETWRSASNHTNDGSRKFAPGTEQQRFEAASSVVNKVSGTVEEHKNDSPDTAAKYFTRVFQPVSTQFGVELSANITGDDLKGWSLQDLKVGSYFRKSDGIGFMAPGGVFAGGFNVHSHPLEDPSGHWNEPFSTGDIDFMRATQSTGYVSTPSMQLFKTEAGGPVEEIK